MGDCSFVLSKSAAPSDWVLQVVPAQSGGVDRHVRDICDIRRHDCILHVAAEQVVLEFGRGAQRAVLPLARVIFVDALLQGSLGKPHAVHAHSVLAPVRNVVRALQTLRSWPYVVTLHDIDFAVLPPEIDAHEHAERASFIEAAGRLIVPSRYISRRLDAMLGSGQTRELIPNGVDSSSAAPPPDQCQAEFATSSTSPVGPFVVAVVGALGRHKGLDFLTEMASRLRSDVRIVVIGYVDGKIEPGWLVDERVWVHGAFEPYELPAIVQRYGCRIALFPNRQPESFCYALSDAWSAGLPALGPDSGALGERIIESGAGWTYPAGASAASVAAELENCLTKITSELRGKVNTAVSVAFTRQEMADALGKVYDGVSTVADSESPADAALRALPLAHLDGAFFRAEIRRLSGDLTFCNGQIRQLTSELEGLVAETTLRGRTIENLRAELQTLNDVQARALRVIEELEQRITQDRESRHRVETKLNQDVAHTLAAAHRYERALAQLPGPIRGWALRRADNNNQ